MKSPLTISLDSSTISRVKAQCGAASLGVSAYIEHLIAVGPEPSASLGQWLNSKNKGKDVGSLQSFSGRKPVMEWKGWHFHVGNEYCATPDCPRERIASPSMYEDENGKIVNL